MPQGFRYDVRTGAAVAEIHASTEDGFDAQATTGFPVVRSDETLDQVWVERGMVKPRQTIELEQHQYRMLLGETLTISAPAGAFLMHELSVLESNGSVSFTPDEFGETRLRFVGRYKTDDIVIHVSSLEVERVNLRAATDVQKQTIISRGVEHAGHFWDANPESQDALKGAVQSAQLGLLPPDFYWTDRDNVNVPVDADQLLGIAQAVIRFAFAAHSRAQEIKASIEEASSLDLLAAINIEAGWPV